jgi:hypothetical protein
MGRNRSNATAPAVKGDLVAGTGVDTSGVLALGSNGDTLVADSSTSTGLRYNANFAAGKNKIINGDMNIWQRGTSFTPSPDTTTYTSDRFFTNRNGTGATITISRQAFTPGTAPVAGYESQYFYRFAQSVAGTGGTYCIPISQKIEDVRTFVGQNFTVSFWAKADAARTLTLEPGQNFGTGGSSEVYFPSQAVTLTTSWVRYSLTFGGASIAGKTLGSGSFLMLNFLSAVNTVQTIDMWGLQAEAGSVATAFQTATGTIQGELAACQRYYVRQSASTSGAYAVLAFGAGVESSTQAIGYTYLPVELRTYPTAIEYGGTLRIIPFAGSESAVTAITLQDRSSTKIVSITYTGSGMSAGNYCFIRANNSSTAYIGISAEL